MSTCSSTLASIAPWLRFTEGHTTSAWSSTICDSYVTCCCLVLILKALFFLPLPIQCLEIVWCSKEGFVYTKIRKTSLQPTYSWSLNVNGIVVVGQSLYVLRLERLACGLPTPHRTLQQATNSVVFCFCCTPKAPLSWTIMISKKAKITKKA